MGTNYFYQSILIAILLLIVKPTFSQSLPNIQTKSQWLPQSINVDGKLLEWNGLSNAYNKATRIKYTIANDTKRLYLAISSEDNTTTAKILSGGIRLSLENAETSNKNMVEQVIFFPLTNSTYSYVETGWPVKTFKLLADSVSILQAMTQFKDIKVLGFQSITDSIISIYNEYGIKTKLGYASDVLVYEISIPLYLLNIEAKNLNILKYKVRLNGVPVPPRPAGIAMPQKLPSPVIIPKGGVNEMEIQTATDFNGKYYVLKK